MSQQFINSCLNYKQIIGDLVSNLRQLREFSEYLEIEKKETLNNILARVTKDTFSIAVVGEFNRGKSTFINAFLHQDVLPSEILATTATITRVKNRFTPGAKVCYQDGTEQEISLNFLKEYVTKLSETLEATAAKIAEAIVYYPLPFSKDYDIEIIDTPGLSDDPQMTEKTLAILQQSDMAIMLISATSPLAMSESEFITDKLLGGGIIKILLVVNQIDQLKSPKDAERVINLVENRVKGAIADWIEQQDNPEELSQTLKIPQVFGISAFQALIARQTENINLLASSRFVNMEYALKEIITKEQGIIRWELSVNNLIVCAKEIQQAILAKQEEVENKINTINQFKRIISRIIEDLRREIQETIDLIERMITSVEQHNNGASYRLSSRLQDLAKTLINDLTITNQEFKQNPIGVQEKFSQELWQKISAKIKNFGEETKQVSNKSLEIAWNKIEQSRNLLENRLIQINQIFLELNKDNNIKVQGNNLINGLKIAQNNKKEENLSLLLVEDSRMFVYADDASGAGTAIGATIGFLFGGPVGGGIGAAIGSSVGGERRANTFKDRYTPQVLATIEARVNSLNVEEVVGKYLSLTCAPLKEIKYLLLEEGNTLVNKILATTAQIYLNSEATLTAKRQSLQEMQAETEKIIAQNQLLFTNH